MPRRSVSYLLRKMVQRAERASSEYNERTKIYVSEKKASLDDGLQLHHQVTVPRTKRRLQRWRKEKKSVSVCSGDSRQPPTIMVTQSESLEDDEPLPPSL